MDLIHTNKLQQILVVPPGDGLQFQQTCQMVVNDDAGGLELFLNWTFNWFLVCWEFLSWIIFAVIHPEASPTRVLSKWYNFMVRIHCYKQQCPQTSVGTSVNSPLVYRSCLLQWLLLIWRGSVRESCSTLFNASICRTSNAMSISFCSLSFADGIIYWISRCSVVYSWWCTSSL